MKNKLLLAFILMMACMNAVAQNVTSYTTTFAQPGYTPITTAGGATLLWNPAANTDDATTGNIGVPASPVLPFAFTYGCFSYAANTALSVNTNGWVAFGQTSSTSFNNTTTPHVLSGITAPAPNENVLWPFWEDQMLNIPAAPFPGSQILTQTLGVTPNRVFVIQFQNMDIFPAGLPAAMANYQVRLYEGSNRIGYNYGTFTMTDGTAYTGTTATIGIQAGSTNAPTAPVNFISVTPNGTGASTTSTVTRNNAVNPLQQGASPAITNGMEILFSPGPNDVALALTSLFCSQLCFSVTNNGCTALPAGQTIPVSVQVDGGAITAGTLTLVATLLPGATVNSCTAGAITGIPAVLSALPQTPTASGVHVVGVTITPAVAIDGVLTNNFIQGIYTPAVTVSNATPYCANFDASGEGWSSVGPNPFVLATNGGIISATQAWHSNSGATADGTKYILQSPCFNLSGMCNPRIAFNYGISTNDVVWDGFKLQFTTDNGTTWNDIPDPTAACNFSNWTPGATSSTNILSTSTIGGAAFGGTNDGWTADANPGSGYANLPAAAINATTVFRVVVGMAGGTPNMDMYFDNFRIWDMTELSMVTLLKPVLPTPTCPGTFDVVVRLQNNQTCAVNLSKYNIAFNGTIDKPTGADQAVTTLATGGFVDATIAAPVATTTIPANGTVDIVAFTGLTMNASGQYVFGNANVNAINPGVLGSICFNVVPSATFFGCGINPMGISTATNAVVTSTAASLESNATCTGGVNGAGVNNCLTPTTRTIAETSDLSLVGPATICEGDELIVDATDATLVPNTLSPIAWFSLTQPNKLGFPGIGLVGCNSLLDLPGGADNLTFETLKTIPVYPNPLTTTGTYHFAAISGVIGTDCVDTAYITVVVQPKPALQVTATMMELCVGETLTLTATDNNPLTANSNKALNWGVTTAPVGIPFDAAMFGPVSGTVSSVGTVIGNDTYTEVVTTPGLYYYAASIPAVAGACNAISVVCVRVHATTAPPIPDPLAATVCTGGTATLHATAVPPIPTTVNGFNGLYAPANWTQSILNDDLSIGNGTIVADNECVLITSGNQSDDCNGANNFPSITQYCITAAATGNITFDWWYNTNDLSTEYDYPSIDINGAEVWNTVVPVTPLSGFDNTVAGALNQNGTASIAVAVGDQVCIRMYSDDNSFGVATLFVSNFTAPIPPVAPTIDWYDVPTGGTVLSTTDSYDAGAPTPTMNFVTPALTETDTFYMETNLGIVGCRERAQVIVTVIKPNVPNCNTTLPAELCLDEIFDLQLELGAGDYVNYGLDAPTDGYIYWLVSTGMPDVPTNPILSTNIIDAQQADASTDDGNPTTNELDNGLVANLSGNLLGLNPATLYCFTPVNGYDGFSFDPSCYDYGTTFCITFAQPISANYTLACDPSGTGVQVTYTVAGGTPPYKVAGTTGTWVPDNSASGNQYVISLPQGGAWNVEFSDETDNNAATDNDGCSIASAGIYTIQTPTITGLPDNLCIDEAAAPFQVNTLMDDAVFTITGFTDDYPGENTVVLVSVATGAMYFYPLGTGFGAIPVNSTINLPSGDYNIFFEDTFGDGMIAGTCGFGGIDGAITFTDVASGFSIGPYTDPGDGACGNISSSNNLVGTITLTPAYNYGMLTATNNAGSNDGVADGSLAPVGTTTTFVPTPADQTGLPGTSTFDPTISGAGEWLLTYTFNDGLGCPTTVTDSIDVYTPPVPDAPTTTCNCDATYNVTIPVAGISAAAGVWNTILDDDENGAAAGDETAFTVTTTAGTLVTTTISADGDVVVNNIPAGTDITVTIGTTAENGGACNATVAVTAPVCTVMDVTVTTPIEVCQGVTSGDLAYTIVAGTPNEYSIDFDATAEGEGFADVPVATALPASPITVAIPAAAAPITYDATITFTDNVTGCSVTYPFEVVVNPEPSIAICTPAPICVGATSVVLNYLCPEGMPDEYSIDFADAAITDIIPAIALPASPLTLTVPASLTAGTYTGTITVYNTTTGCEKDIPFSFEVIDCCPVLTAAAPVAIVSSQSTCTANVLSGGVIAAPTTTCPPGSTLQYSTDGGATWSTTLPIYDQDGPAQFISTRCNCNTNTAISSPISAITTVPGICPPVCSINIAGICVGACSSNQYGIQIFVVSNNGTGNMEVSIDGGAYSNATAPDVDGTTTITVSNLTADAASHTVDVRFAGNTTCAATQTTYTAPATCTISCSITSVVAVLGTCNDGGGTVATSDDYYNATVVVSYNNASAGTIDLSGVALATGGITSSAAITGGTGTVTISGVRLLPNLGAATLTATHSAAPACTLNTIVNTGAPCSPAVCGGANAGSIVTGN